MMGSPDGEVRGGGFDELLHVVTLTKGFWIGIYPITQAQWRVVADTDPSHFKGDTLPVEQVSWDDTQAFCAALKQKAGIELRLPTEAEWEYAARGGTTTPYYWGDELNGTQANCGGFSPYGTKRAGPSVEKPTRVGNYAESFPHPWGLADVIGNVCEWCADWYGSYPTGVAVDPTGPNTGSRRVCRGGRWWDSAKHCRAASRDKNPPDNSDNGIGFRLAADAASLG